MSLDGLKIPKMNLPKPIQYTQALNPLVPVGGISEGVVHLKVTRNDLFEGRPQVGLDLIHAPEIPDTNMRTTRRRPLHGGIEKWEKFTQENFMEVVSYVKKA